MSFFHNAVPARSQESDSKESQPEKMAKIGKLSAWSPPKFKESFLLSVAGLGLRHHGTTATKLQTTADVIQPQQYYYCTEVQYCTTEKREKKKANYFHFPPLFHTSIRSKKTLFIASAPLKNKVTNSGDGKGRDSFGLFGEG